jgi:hypothetical protein
MPQEIALAFITKFPMLGSNILQIKWHLKHINCKKKPTYSNKIFSNENGKKSNITIPHEKNLAQKIENTKTQLFPKLCIM